jgi:hypothetical protein
MYRRRECVCDLKCELLFQRSVFTACSTIEKVHFSVLQSHSCSFKTKTPFEDEELVKEAMSAVESLFEGFGKQTEIVS